jgi:hypothetical protein
MLSRIHSRLKQQLIDKGREESESEGLAKNILIKRGHLNKDGSVTTEGYIRGNMSAADRAIDRAVKRSGGIPEYYEYDAENNYAYKKTGKGVWRKKGNR